MHCCIVVKQGIHLNFRRAPRSVLPREASLALVTPDAHLSDLKLAIFLSHLSNIHSGVFTALGISHNYVASNKPYFPARGENRKSAARNSLGQVQGYARREERERNGRRVPPAAI